MLENAWLPPPLQTANALGALLAVAGIFAELQNCRTFVYVDIALTNAALLVALPALTCALNDTVMEALSDGLPWYAIYRCSDGKMIALGALELKFRELFCYMVGRPDLLTLERNDLQVALTTLFASCSQSEWLEQFAADLPVTPVLALQEAMQLRMPVRHGVLLSATYPVGERNGGPDAVVDRKRTDTVLECLPKLSASSFLLARSLG